MRKRYYFVKVDPSDLLTGMADLSDAERGVYVTLLALMWDTGRSLACRTAEERQSLARRCGCTTRRFGVTLDLLIKREKIREVDGLLLNKRALQTTRERDALSQVRSEAAREGWEARREEKNDFSSQKTQENSQTSDANASEPETGPISDFSGRKNGEKTEKNSRKNEDKSELLPQETAENSQSDDANASPLARARVSELRYNTTTPTINLEVVGGRADALDDDPPKMDLFALTTAVCDAAGLSARVASRPALLTQSMDIVKGWISAGIDINATALPVIRAEVAKMAEPAHSLNRFAAAIDTQNAKMRNSVKTGRPAPPPREPVYLFSDEKPVIEPFRRALSQRIGEGNYATWCSELRFEVGDRLSDGDNEILFVCLRSGSHAFRRTEIIDQYRPLIAAIARETLSTTHVWEK